MSKSYWVRSVCGDLDSLMDRTVLQLFGVFIVFIRSIGPYSAYCRVFEQK
ncbi:hypothetical protein [Paenibacillus sp. FSL H7-0918]